jgi:hypothetical protein
MTVYNKTTLGILAIVATLGILTASTALTIQPAHALSKFFNCTTDVANKTHNLTLEDVNACYNKEFHTSGGPGTGITPTTTISTNTHITTTQSGEHRGSLHHQDAIRTSIHCPSSSSEGYHRAHNEGFSSSSTAATAASIDELLRGYSGVSGNAAASSSSSSSGGASASASATSR